MKARLLHGDARNPAALGIEPRSVDAIITSPPYWNLKRYGDEVEGEIGHGQSLEDYLDDMRNVLAACFELTKDSGVMWLIADTLRFPPRTSREFELLPLPNLLAELAQKAGWRFHDLVIWRKNKTLPYSGDRKLRNLVEYIVLLTKSREFKHRPYRLTERHQPNAEWLAGWPDRYHPLGKNPSNIWDLSIPTQGIWTQTERLHFCPLPAELVRRCIDLTTDPGDVVFDPFAGIGTVPAQAEAMERRGLGIELNPAFIEIFETRTRPDFIASWEEGAARRQLRREDQLDEAALILKLRALKAGKELLRHIEQLVQTRPSGHPSAEVTSIIVRIGDDLSEFIDVLNGRIDAPPVELLVVGCFGADEVRELTTLLAEALDSTAFRTFGLALDFKLTESSRVDDDIQLTLEGEVKKTPLFEFDVSRHGAFTQRPMPGLFPTLPRLLTTIELGPPLHPTTLSPLEQARAEGEKKLLTTLLSSGEPLEVVAKQLRLPRVELDQLLRKHDLAAKSPAFAVVLPEDLAALADSAER